MGLIKAALGAAGGVLADQWKEYFYCEAIPADVLAVKGQKKVTGRSSNTKGDENIISNGSIIAVADGQCMLIVEQGKVVDVCAEPGEYTYDMSTEPSIFTGNLGESIKSVFANIGKRFTFGVSSVKAEEEDEKMLKELQRNAAFMDPTRAAAHLVGAQASAMQAAASNTATGPAMAFMGMNMAGQAGGMNAQSLFQMGQQQQMQQQQMQQQAAPAAPAGWTCSCGAVNKGKFCAECGAKKPAGVPQYKCDKCGWEPEDKAHPPKFCPECGDPFDDGDLV